MTILLASFGVATSNGAFAADSSSSPYKTQSEDTEFSETPYTEYGSFNEDAEEDADTRFFQYGRFFGVSVGLGFQGVTGNRGQLWQGGFPLVDVKIHYWFDFNFALQMGFATVSHQYDDSTSGRNGLYDVNMNRLGVDLKYYFDTRNLSAAVSFANPHIMLGVARYGKTEYNDVQSIREQDNAVGFNGGVGFEFTLKPRKSYVFIESKIHSVRFKDTYTSRISGYTDLTGYFFTFAGGFLFTW